MKQKNSESIKGIGSLIPKKKVAKIYFPTNNSALDQQDKTELNRLCQIFNVVLPQKKVPQLLVAVGNADHRGNKSYNLRLSKQRAMRVAEYIQRMSPGAYVLWRALGEINANQSDFFGLGLGYVLDLSAPNVSKQQLADERRVDVFYGQLPPIRIGIGGKLPPPIPDIVDDAIRIVKTKKASHPNQTERLLCYLNKIKQKATPKNDRYWSFKDIESCRHYVYPGGQFDILGFIKVEAELNRRAKSARGFLKENVASKKGDNAKFESLLLLDQTIYQSYQKVVAKLGSNQFGGDMLKYYRYMKDILLGLIKDTDTLYSCIKFKLTILP